MKLERRTFIYSVLLAFLVSTFIIGYMIFLIPSLYTDYKLTKNFDDVKITHLNFFKQGNMNQAIGSTKDNVIGLTLKDGEYLINIDSISFEGQFEIQDQELKQFIDQLRMLITDSNQQKDVLADMIKGNNQEFQEKLNMMEAKLNILVKEWSEQLNLQLVSKDKLLNIENKQSRLVSLGSHSVIIENTMVNLTSKSNYSSYLAVTHQDNQLYLTLASMLTPDPNDIRPIMVNAIYVILPVMLLLALGMSHLLSKKIVKPIEELSADAEKRKNDQQFKAIPIEGDYEIRQLQQNLNLLYLEKEKHIQHLQLESQQKEVFMRSFSHQLKTPLASSILLVDSMIDNVGQFSNRDKYLPMLKVQLLSMKKILSHIMEATRLINQQNLQVVNLNHILNKVIDDNKIKAIEKELIVKLKGDATWLSDELILSQIFDNLMNNAVKYTAPKGHIGIILSPDSVIIENTPSQIEDTVKPMMFEAFVTGSEVEGNGLGLYLVKYYADALKLAIEFENEADTVRFTLRRRA